MSVRFHLRIPLFVTTRLTASVSSWFGFFAVANNTISAEVVVLESGFSDRRYGISMIKGSETTEKYQGCYEKSSTSDQREVALIALGEQEE